MRILIPLLCLAIVAVTLVVALTAERPPEFTHGFPDASRRPPLSIVLSEATSDAPDERLRAVMLLGYFRSERAYRALLLALHDHDMVIRLRALEGLRLQQDERALPAIAEVRRTDREGIVRVKAEEVLDEIQYPFGPPQGAPTMDEQWGGPSLDGKNVPSAETGPPRPAAPAAPSPSSVAPSPVVPPTPPIPPATAPSPASMAP